MAAITAADITVTLNLEDVDRSPDVGIRTFPMIVFGDGALTYPALGIPMPAIGKFGFHFAIKRAYIEQPANGYIYSFDRANHKLRIFLGGAHAHNLIVAGNGTYPFNAGIGVNTGNAALSSNVANAVTVVGGNATKGGVQYKGAAALVEIGAVALAATTLYMEMVGK